MKVITIAQTKGGAGKTSTAMLLASAALNRDLKVHVIDADHNAQILKWKDRVVAHDPTTAERWPEGLTVSLGKETEDEIVAAFNALAEGDADLVIVDTRGGSAFGTESYALMSDVILIPTRPLEGEIVEATDTWRWMDDLRASLADQDDMPPVHSVVLGPPYDVYAALRSGTFESLPASRRAILERIADLSPLPTVVPQSRIIEEFRRWGPLSMRIDELERSSTPVARLQLRNFMPIMETALALLDDVFAALRG